MERKVLIISGRPPKHSAGFVQDTINILELAGCKVDFLTLYDFEGQKENQYNVLKKPWNLKIIDVLIKHPWLRFFKFVYHLPYKMISRIKRRSVSLMHGNYLLVFENEEEPPICPDLIFEKIHDNYDYFIVMIVQDIVTSKSIQMLYNKYHKPVIILSPDMYNFTGNCFFPNDCTQYLNECRNCPAYKEIGLKDIAHENFTYKKGVFDSIRCAFNGNTYMVDFVRKTKIIPERKMFKSTFFLDVDIFKPHNKVLCRKRFDISEDKSFIIMIRYIGPHNLDWGRKGGIYLIESLDLLYNKMTEAEREKCLLFFVGTRSVDPEMNLKFETYCAGSLNKSDLILAYNASSVFFCPSINDSGPSMLNQAMACSTPAVAFNQGTAKDVVDNGINGFKVDLYDTDGLSDALLSILRMDKDQYQILSNNARQKAVDCNSLEAGARHFQHIFESFEKGVL